MLRCNKERASLIHRGFGEPIVQAEAFMRKGQNVRIRPFSGLMETHRLNPDARGEVLCRYRVLSRGAAIIERMDVRLTGGRIVWGAPASAFEAIEDGGDRRSIQ